MFSFRNITVLLFLLFQLVGFAQSCDDEANKNNKMSEHEKHNSEAEEKIVKTVKEHGWFVALFEATKYLPSFGYTIGLWENYKHPELIVFGLRTETLHSILNIGGEIVKSGEKIIPNQKSDEFLESSEVYIFEVQKENLKDYFGYGLWFNKGEFPAYQIVWSDRNQVFPWEKDFEDIFLNKQPLIDRNADFKFREEKNLGVITMKQFLEEGKDILYVEHDDEGDWTFLTGDELSSSDARLVSLETIINTDNSINELFNLDYGEFASRASIKDKWVRGKMENE